MESSWMPPTSSTKRVSRPAVSGSARGRARCWRSRKSAVTARSGIGRAGIHRRLPPRGRIASMGTAAALALVIGGAVVTALIALPLALRKIPPMRLYGVRTRRTLADDRVWYETNAYGGRCLIVASAVTIAMVVLLGLTPL